MSSSSYHADDNGRNRRLRQLRSKLAALRAASSSSSSTSSSSGIDHPSSGAAASASTSDSLASLSSSSSSSLHPPLSTIAAATGIGGAPVARPPLHYGRTSRGRQPPRSAVPSSFSTAAWSPPPPPSISPPASPPPPPQPGGSGGGGGSTGGVSVKHAASLHEYFRESLERLWTAPVAAGDAEARRPGRVPSLLQLSANALAASAPVRSDREGCLHDDEWYEAIPWYLRGLPLVQHLVELCKAEVKAPCVFEGLVMICLEADAVWQAYDLMKHMWRLIPVHRLDDYLWSFDCAQRMNKVSQWSEYVAANLTADRCLALGFNSFLSARCLWPHCRSHLQDCFYLQTCQASLRVKARLAARAVQIMCFSRVQFRSVMLDPRFVEWVKAVLVCHPACDCRAFRPCSIALRMAWKSFAQIAAAAASSASGGSSITGSSSKPAAAGTVILASIQATASQREAYAPLLLVGLYHYVRSLMDVNAAAAAAGPGHALEMRGLTQPQSRLVDAALDVLSSLLPHCVAAIESLCCCGPPRRVSGAAAPASVLKFYPAVHVLSALGERFMAHSTLKRIVRVFESSLSSVGFGDGDGFAALGPNRGAVQMRRGGDGRSSSSGLFANGGEGENGDDEDDDDEDDEDDEERLVVKCVELRDELDALAISLEHTPVPNARWRHEPFLDDWVEATPVPPVGRMQRGAEAIRLQRAQPLPLDDETEDDLGFGLSSHPWAARAGRLSRHGGDDDQTGVAQTPLQRRYLPHPSRRARPSEKEEKKEKDDKGFALSDCSSAATTRHNIGSGTEKDTTAKEHGRNRAAAGVARQGKQRGGSKAGSKAGSGCATTRSQSCRKRPRRQQAEMDDEEQTSDESAEEEEEEATADGASKDEQGGGATAEGSDTSETDGESCSSRGRGGSPTKENDGAAFGRGKKGRRVHQPSQRRRRRGRRQRRRRPASESSDDDSGESHCDSVVGEEAEDYEWVARARARATVSAAEAAAAAAESAKRLRLTITNALPFTPDMDDFLVL